MGTMELDRMRLEGCRNCGQAYGETDPMRRIEIDHIVPAARGGADSIENYMPLCGRCNRYKNAWTLEELQTGEFIQWRMIGNGEAVQYPHNFDWATGEWVDFKMTEAARTTWRQMIKERNYDAVEALDNCLSAREEVRSDCEWIVGNLFTYPVKSDNSDMVVS